MTTGINTPAVQQLMERVIGSADGVIFSPLARSGSAHTAASAYEYSAQGGVVQVNATDTIAACAGLYAYLKDVVGAQVTWNTPLPVNVPSIWPDSVPVRRDTPARHRYYLNVVTSGYSAPYWRWQRWQREVDWMALHGITTPLMMVGHEAVLARAFVEHGADLQHVRTWLGSAAHLPWTLMGCMNSFGGPLPESWFADRLDLAQRILASQRALGMRPVLPAFGGHVPEALADPDTPRTTWKGFSTALLDARDPRFVQIAETVTRLQEELLGSDHLYSADPFIESIPPSGEPADLAEHSRAVYRGISSADPEATWIMQAWPFVYQRQFWTTERIRAVTTAVPEDRLLLLDLWAEHTPTWDDGRHITSTPWVWSAVHNFGGRFSVHGDLDNLVRTLGGVLQDSRTGSPNVGNFVGTGLAMEAIENDPVFYELATDLTWRTPALIDWIDDYVCQRYGLSDAPPSAREAATEAWEGLLSTLYRSGATRAIPSPLIVRPADFDPLLPEPHGTEQAGEPGPAEEFSLDMDAETAPHVEDDLPTIADAAGQLLEVGGTQHCPELAADIVDVLTHLVAQRARATIHAAAAAARAGQIDQVTHQGSLLATALTDVDRLAGSQHDRLLGPWLAQAASWGTGPQERATLLRDARRLLTVWAKQGTGLHDYAGKHWSGLLTGFYLPRWQLWIDWLRAIASGDHGADRPTLDRSITAFEESWADDSSIGQTLPSGDVLPIAIELLNRYRVPLR